MSCNCLKSTHLIFQILKPVEISCWHSHFEVLRKIADGEDVVAITLEDDIDLEWDLESRLRYLWQFLPSDWDQVMLGLFLISMVTFFVPWLKYISFRPPTIQRGQKEGGERDFLSISSNAYHVHACLCGIKAECGPASQNPPIPIICIFSSNRSASLFSAFIYLNSQGKF